MKIQYDNDEAIEILNEWAEKKFVGYRITNVTYDKWNGLTIEGEKRTVPKSAQLPEEAPSSPLPLADYNPKDGVSF